MKAVLKNVLAIICLFFATSLPAQERSRAEAQELVLSRRFEFIPQTMMPMSGGTRTLTPDYNLVLSGDSLTSYLPFFGRAYRINPGDEGGIRFVSTSFDYNLKTKKNKGWEISFRPKDTRDVRQLNLTVFDNGYASLFVNSNNRQGIHYYGYIRSVK